MLEACRLHIIGVSGLSRATKEGLNLKRKDTKRALAKFSARSTHKRKKKGKSVDAILAEIASAGVGYEGVRIGDSTDGGRRARTSAKSRRDEMRTEGVYSGTRSGFGFVATSESERDIFIPEGRSGGAIDGDYVEVIYHSYRGYDGADKTEGRVAKIIRAGREVLVGVLDVEHGARRYGRAARRLVFVPDDPAVSVLPIVRECGGAKIGERVAVKIKRGSGTPYNPDCEVVAVLGAPESREANYAAVLIESGIPTEFEREVLAEAEAAADMPIDYEAREDRRGDVIFTIDGAGAKDLDDAVSIRKTSHGWLLGVHIADVSRYVAERTALDRAAMSRGTSVYFVDKVIPMLPPALSNGACSLGPGEDKCAISAFISLNEGGEITSVRVAPTVIRSRVRGVYSEVNSIFAGAAAAEVKKKYREVMNSLVRMRELYLVLKERAAERGMLELDQPEAYIEVNAEGEPIDIRRAERGDAERMIEQFMLTANEAVAVWLREAGAPIVSRLHENPPEDKLREFLDYAKNLGLDIRGISPEAPDPRSLSALLAQAKERGIYAPVSYLLLRSMAKAKYSSAERGHFGIALADYCHFTSPIRRLSDLAVHRIIRRVMFEGKRKSTYASYAARAAAAATDTELRAVSCERRIENIYKAIYMKDKEGEIFFATVSSVASFGMFVMLENTCEGLIPIDDMPGYFLFDEKNMTIGSGNTRYRVGDTVKVRLEESDLAKCKLRFSLIL